MSDQGLLEKEARTVIPRWRPFVATISVDGELAATRTAVEKHQPPYDDSIAQYRQEVSDFQQHRSVWFAGDLLADAISRRDDATAADVAQFILGNQGKASPTLRSIASKVLGLDASSEQLPHQPHPVALIREELSLYPRSAVAWADLAFYLTVAGKFRAAERAIATAVALAPNNRFVLRSAARFYIHQDDPERGHDLLRSAEATPSDPWLLSAEIATATAARRRSRLIARGRSMVKDTSLSRKHISELASAIGTAEIEAAAPRRQIRSMFDASLEKPTENSIAQAGWVSRQHLGASHRPDLGRRTDLFEASAWDAFVSGKFEDAISYAEQWHEDQPFSARPAVLVSWIGSVLLEDHKRSITTLTKAVVPNPDDVMLLNNLAFAHASIGQVDEARRYIDRIKSPTDDHALAAQATKGLVAFREGNIEMGRSLYAEVVERAQSSAKDERLGPMACAFWAREECVAMTPFAPKAVRLAMAAMENSKNLEVQALLRHLGPFLSAYRQKDQLEKSVGGTG